MYPQMKVAISVVVASILTILGVNLQGFFIGAEDDPAWVEPKVEDAAANVPQGVDTEHPGYALFSEQCARCHQENGKGVTGVYPPLVDSDFANGDPTIPIRIVLHGFQGGIERGGTTINGLMTPFSALLSDQEIADILSFVRTSWGNTADEIYPEDVEAIRSATAGRNTTYTEAELLQPL